MKVGKGTESTAAACVLPAAMTQPIDFKSKVLPEFKGCY